MEISLLQAFALGIIAFIAGLDMFNGLTHMHRPVVLGPLVGLVLGDLHTGILTGGTLELVWMGLAPLAGAQPPNVIIGTIVGTAFAITTGVKPDVAVGVAVPFAVAVQMGITFLFSVMSGVMSRCDRMAENADTRGIERVNYLALLALGTFYFLCAFLPIYFGAEHAKTIIDFLTLVKGGVPVNRINVGNMHYANGKQQIAKTVSVDAGDIAAFNDLKAAGVECFVQGVPTEPAVDLFKLL